MMTSMELMIKFGQSFLNIFIESAPWLLFGFFIAGIIKAFIPTDLLQKHLGNNSVMAVIKGAIFGAPLPLCSCGVIPAALGLHRAGASKSATTSFLIATPETGVDSISVTYALLGPFMAIIRPIAAICTAISAGLMVLFFDKDSLNNDNMPPLTQSAEMSGCCSEKHAEQETQNAQSTASCCAASASKPTKEMSSCCSSTSPKRQASSCCSSSVNKSEADGTEGSCCSKSEPVSSHSMIDKIKAGLTFSFFDLLKDISSWLLIGLLLAAVIMTLVPASFLASWGASPYAYLVMALVGVPMYICATSSTPIAAGLLFAGVSPGAILVFLLVGPATNIATMSLVKQELGKISLLIYTVTITVMAFAFGAMTDWLAKRLDIQTMSQISHHHEHVSTLSIFAAALLAVLLINVMWQKYARKL